ncbi:MAG: 5,10-methylene tetrahydromethanopterin reductase [Solibacillus sp.]
MKKMLKITFILFACIVLPFSFSKSPSIPPASAHDLQEKNGRFFHDVPSLHAKKLLPFYNHVTGMALAVKNKWVSIDYQISKSSLHASKVTNQKPATHAKTTSTITGGLLPNVGQSYTYEPSFQGPEKKTYMASKNPYIDNAVNLLVDEYIGFTFIESPTSFALGVANSDVFYFSLHYPMEAKTTIRDTDYGIDSNDYTNVTVVSTTETIHTKAGTFKNVAVLTYPNGSTLYIAKGYGIIKITDYEGNTSTELIAVQD